MYKYVLQTTIHPSPSHHNSVFPERKNLLPYLQNPHTASLQRIYFMRETRKQAAVPVAKDSVAHAA